MNYLILLPFDLRQHFYYNYLIIPKALNVYWCELPALASCDKTIYQGREEYSMKEKAFSYFVIHGYLKLIIWVHRKNWPHYDNVISLAAAFGHLDVLKWLLCNTNYSQIRMLYMAVEAGHLHILQYLMELGHLVNSDIVTCAIIWNHLHILQWLHEAAITKGNTCLLLFDAARKAIIYERGNIIVWLLERGYSDDYEIRLAATLSNKLKILELLDIVAASKRGILQN